ncbi:hypothetical protein [Curtobacterium sp. MCBA15_008]|jgi:hypothetical protein|uniref:hypothetical protein n=1 Tax=Curtobacterium sp. MCBA15_008 TaxID=1898736 RepID=UPI0008DD3048|nr:hypothetical protein [Curtobacterium sp. MCBA15_008]OII13312.1 hypothetical protein BIU96_14385 [Curtobacterium sp. MCBA15_008]
MQLAPRPIAALAVVGALSLLAAGCSAGGDDPTPSPTRSASATASATPTATATETPSTAPTQGTDDPSTGDDDAGDVPTAFPGSGQTAQPDTDPSDFPATALVTFSGWDAGSKTLQAGGLVSGTTNAGGTCTFTATKSGVTRTLTTAAEASASSVNCAQASFPASQVSTGTWSITLKYSVGSQSTTSDPMTAEVP